MLKGSTPVRVATPIRRGTRPMVLPHVQLRRPVQPQGLLIQLRSVAKPTKIAPVSRRLPPMVHLFNNVPVTFILFTCLVLSHHRTRAFSRNHVSSDYTFLNSFTVIECDSTTRVSGRGHNMAEVNICFSRSSGFDIGAKLIIDTAGLGSVSISLNGHSCGFCTIGNGRLCAAGRWIARGHESVLSTQTFSNGSTNIYAGHIDTH